MQPCFTSEGTWFGGFYELTMQFGLHADPALEAALQAIWKRPELEGCYLSADVEPCHQQRIRPSLATLLSEGHLRGIASLPNGRRVACGSYVVREDSGDNWLGFYLPLGALQAAYPIGAYPFEDSQTSREWREPLENWMADIGRTVFGVAPFRIGLVGFEVSGFEAADHVTTSGIPAERGIGYLIPFAGKLEWYPTNQWQQPKPVS
jgi:hypothetical protein